VHVDFNSETGFIGLPAEWENLLKEGGIDREMVLNNPDAVLDVLEFAKACTDSSLKVVPIPLEQTLKNIKLKELVSKEDPRKLFPKKEKIGEGASAEIFRVDDTQRTQEAKDLEQIKILILLARKKSKESPFYKLPMEIVVKIFSHTKKVYPSIALKIMQLSPDSMSLITSEIQIMKMTRHPNIVGYIDSYIVDNKKLWIAMEFMEKGCLTEILEQFETFRMEEAEIAWVCQEVLKGLEYIHSRHRIHRDIKSDNLLIGEKRRSQNRRFRLCRTAFKAEAKTKHCCWHSLLDGTGIDSWA